MRRQIELSNEVAAELAGTGDPVLRALEEHVDCDVFLRGNVITLDGDAEAVAGGATVVRELAELIEQGHEIGPGTITAVTGALDQHAVARRDPRGRRVAPPLARRSRRRPSTRSATSTRSARNTITFGIGPAGTGKTFLAVAMAAAALTRREVNRIILTRPAVEAGERLGFLPGDLMAKIDPYLRPLFDALHDMLDPEKVAAHLERGVIEVAPLAFMRGRAQPVDQPVLTPDGWRADRDAAGRRPRHRVRRARRRRSSACSRRARARCSASRRRTARRRWLRRAPVVRHDAGRPQARQGRPCRRDARHDRAAAAQPSAPLRAAARRARRCEIEPRPVPMDPYALGLLLGDGCLTTTTTPSFSTADPELADGARGGAATGIELRHRGEPDYVLRNIDGGAAA